MPALVLALVLTFAALLVVSGAEKLTHPTPAALALHRAGFPAPAALARVVAGVELVAGVGAFVVGGALGGAAVAIVYGGFTAFLVSRWAAGDLGVPCGCFGEGSPLGPTHVAVDVVAVLVGVAAVATGAPTVAELADESGVVALLDALVLAGTAAGLLRMLLIRVPPKSIAEAG